MTWIAIAVAGACGAVSRFLVDHFVTSRISGQFPWGTFVVNVTGSLAAGIVLGLVATRGFPDGFDTIVAGGFLGAYTTFSTSMYETATLVEEQRYAVSAINLIISLAACVVAATLGYSLAYSLVAV